MARTKQTPENAARKAAAQAQEKRDALKEKAKPDEDDAADKPEATVVCADATDATDATGVDEKPAGPGDAPHDAPEAKSDEKKDGDDDEDEEENENEEEDDDEDEDEHSEYDSGDEDAKGSDIDPDETQANAETQADAETKVDGNGAMDDKDDKQENAAKGKRKKAVAQMSEPHADDVIDLTSPTKKPKTVNAERSPSPEY